MRPFRFPSLGNCSEQPSRHNHPSPRRDPDERLGQINILGPIYRRPPAPPSRDIQLAAARDSESSLHIHPPRLAQAGPRSPSRPSPTTLAAARGCGGGGGGGGLGVAAEAPLGGEQAPTEVLERLPDGVLRPRRAPPHSEFWPRRVRIRLRRYRRFWSRRVRIRLCRYRRFWPRRVPPQSESESAARNALVRLAPGGAASRRCKTSGRPILNA